MVNFTMLAHNRPKLTKQALTSLGDVENIIVCCDNFNDGEMRSVLNEWSNNNASKSKLHYYITKPMGTGALRNDVIATSEQACGRGDYLYLGDNDSFFFPAFFEKIIPIYESAWQQGFKVLGGVGHPYHQPIASLPVHIGGQQVSRILEVQAQPLQSMLLKWEVWDKYGPFDETPPGRVRMSEDVSFTNKIRADGGKIGVVDPPLVVNCGITDSFGEKVPGWQEVLKQVPNGVFAE